MPTSSGRFFLGHPAYRWSTSWAARDPRTTKELLDIPTNHASGEEAVGAIFDQVQGEKAKRDDTVDEGPSDRFGKKNKKNKKKGGGSIVAMADRKPGKEPAGQTNDHFEKMLEKPCPNHQHRVSHLMKHCSLLKKWLAGNRKKGEPKKKPEPEGDAEGDKEEDFPEHDVLMIFGGPVAYESRRNQNLTLREVFATPKFLRWSESPITFDRADHPKNVPHPGRCALVADPIVGNKRLSKVLVDGGSGLNILYADTLDAMGIDRVRLRHSGAPFHGVVPGKQAVPLRQIDLPVTFGDPSNFRKETLMFEVVGFKGAYHTILGRPCYAKFMAVPNYTYLKLKMPGPHGVITVGSTFQHAYRCKVGSCELASAVLATEELALIRENIPEEAPDSN